MLKCALHYIREVSGSLVFSSLPLVAWQVHRIARALNIDLANRNLAERIAASLNAKLCELPIRLNAVNY